MSAKDVDVIALLRYFYAAGRWEGWGRKDDPRSKRPELRYWRWRSIDDLRRVEQRLNREIGRTSLDFDHPLIPIAIVVGDARRTLERGMTCQDD